MLLDFEFPLAYRPTPPVIDGSLTGWTDAELLPPLSRLDGPAPFAPVWACWNESGLFLACRVENKRQPLRCHPAVFWKGDNLRLCTDMRDARSNRRATRYCQQFYILPTGHGPRADQPVAGSAKILRAREDAPLFYSASGTPTSARSTANQTALLRVASWVTPTAYRLEAHIPAQCLNGFDPTEHPRIGFYYMLEDGDHGQQFLTVGDELNWFADPSTWATAVLAR